MIPSDINFQVSTGLSSFSFKVQKESQYRYLWNRNSSRQKNLPLSRSYSLYCRANVALSDDSLSLVAQLMQFYAAFFLLKPARFKSLNMADLRSFFLERSKSNNLVLRSFWERQGLCRMIYLTCFILQMVLSLKPSISCSSIWLYFDRVGSMSHSFRIDMREDQVILYFQQSYAIWIAVFSSF